MPCTFQLPAWVYVRPCAGGRIKLVQPPAGLSKRCRPAPHFKEAVWED